MFFPNYFSSIYPGTDILTYLIKPLIKENTSKSTDDFQFQETARTISLDGKMEPPYSLAPPPPAPSLMIAGGCYQQFFGSLIEPVFYLTGHLFLVIFMNKVFSVNFSNFTLGFKICD